MRLMQPLPLSLKIWVFGQAAITVGAARVALWLLPYRVVRKWAQKRALPDGAPTQHGVLPRHVGKAISMAGWFLPKGNCLPQALAACKLLGRYGHPAQLHIGVRKDDTGALRAHAWVSSGAEVVVGGTESTQIYQQMSSLTSRVASGTH